MQFFLNAESLDDGVGLFSHTVSLNGCVWSGDLLLSPSDYSPLLPQAAMHFKSPMPSVAREHYPPFSS